MNADGLPTEPPEEPILSVTEEKVRALVEQFSDALRRGETPDPFEWLLAHPELAADLEPRLSQVQRLYEQMRPVASSQPRPAGPAATADGLPGYVGRYRIDGLLGQGNQAIVFRAYDPKFERPIALKVLHPNLAASSGYLQRFHQAAKVVAKLRHPNIVELHDAGQDAGFHYIDMFLVEGETLQQHLERLGGGRLPYRHTAELMYKLAQALHHAHEQGVVHRDFKPANILLPVASANGSGEPQLTDFGLARELDLDATQSRPGAIVGTLAYMAPEQSEGRSHAADARSDVYALGAVLYELLTGRWPYHESKTFADLVQRKSHEDPLPPRRLNPEAPRDLETICLKALERDPGQRFATAQAMAEELWRWQHDEPLTIRPTTRLEKVRRWARRNRAAAVLTGALAAVVLIAAGAFTWARMERNLEAQVRERLETENAELRDEALREFEIFHMLNAWQRLQVPTQGRRHEALAQMKKVIEKRRTLKLPLIDASMRSLYAAALGVPDLKSAAVIGFKDDPFLLLPTTLHVHGKQMVIGAASGPVPWRLGEKLKLTDEQLIKKPLPRLSHCPNGQYLAYAPAAGGVTLRAAADVTTILHQQPDAGVVLGLGFNRAGDVLWTVNADGKAQQWSVPDLQLASSWEIPVGAKRFTVAAVSAAGDVLLGDAGGRVVRSSSADRPVQKIATFDIEVEALAWSPDAAQIAIGTRDSVVHLTDPAGKVARRFNLLGNGVGRLLFTPDSQWLLAGQRGASMIIWDTLTGDQVLKGNYVPWDFAGETWRFGNSMIGQAAFVDIERPVATAHLRGHQVAIDQLAWSRDGRHIASLDARGEIRVWDVLRAVGIDRVQAQPGSFYGSNSGIALSDDGRWLAFASGGKDSVMLLHEVQSGKPPRTWRLPDGFDRLACAGGSVFRSVREEEDAPGSKRWQTVTRDLDPDAGLSKPRVLRPHQPGDVHFYSSKLSDHGGRYAWFGPRAPAEAVRAEVYDVAKGERIFQRHVVHTKLHHSIDGRLDTAGRTLWINSREDPKQGMLHDLSGARPPQPMLGAPQFSSDGRWQITGHRDPIRQPSVNESLTPAGKEPPWLYLPSGIGSPMFSPDSRRIAVGITTGTLFVVDLDVLKERVDAFERAELAR